MEHELEILILGYLELTFGHLEATKMAKKGTDIIEDATETLSWGGPPLPKV